jgi:hypothetical protein
MICATLSPRYFLEKHDLFGLPNVGETKKDTSCEISRIGTSTEAIMHGSTDSKLHHKLWAKIPERGDF